MKTLKKLILLIAAAMMLAAMVSCSHEAGTENGGGTGTGTQTTPEYPAVFDGFQPIPALGEGAGMKSLLTFNANGTWVLSSVLPTKNDSYDPPYTITVIQQSLKGTYSGNPFVNGQVVLNYTHQFDSNKKPDYSNRYTALFNARQDATLLVDDTLMTWKDYEGEETTTTITITNGTTSFEGATYTIQE